MVKKALILAMLPLSIWGQDLSDHVKVRNLYIEGEKRVLTNRDYFLNENRIPHNDLNLGLDLDLPATLYYNNKVNSIVDTNQFRYIGYTFELGARPFKGIEVYFQHFSGHALDETFDYRGFPQFNKVGVRFYLWKR
jgi:hypothetical protein